MRYSNSILKLKALTLNLVGVYFFAFSLIQTRPLNAQCVPTSAQITSSSDDDANFWINGTAISGTSTYCNLGCVPTPIPVPTTVFNAGQSIVLSIATTNTNPSLGFSSWDLDITCQGGGNSEITSENPALTSLYYDPNGNCAGAVPPPNDSVGNTWTSLIYNPSPNLFTGNGAAVTGTTYATRIYNPVTGNQILPMSYNPSAAMGSCGVLYWREAIEIPTPVPTLGPPNITVTNSLISGSVTTSGNDLYASYAVTLCNSGQAVANTPVTLTDSFSNNMQGNSSNCPNNSGQPAAPQYQCNSPYSVIFPTGLPGGGQCQAVTVNIINYYYPNNYGQAVTATADVAWNGNGYSGNVDSNTVTFFIPGPPTSTPTPTLTPTATPQFTPTWTLSPTITLTPTVTLTPTITLSPTFTPTATLTLTPTETYTITLTPTITNTPTITLTPTVTETPGPVIFYVSKNVITPDSGPVSIYASYQVPGNYAMRIYNSAGEFITNLTGTNPNGVSHSFFWDGTNFNQQKCASGIYIIYYLQPQKVSEAKILLLR